MQTRLHRHLMLAGLTLIAACSGSSDVRITQPALPLAIGVHGAVEADAAGDAVRRWSDLSLSLAPSLVQGPLPPFVEARLYAITNVAMHDALNGIQRRYDRYADTGPENADANAAAAVIAAAYGAIIGATPVAAHAATLAAYTTEIAALTAGGDAASVNDGIAIGQRAAAAVLSRRQNDGTAGGGVAPYTPGTQPGDYQFTFPFNTDFFNFFGTGGFADGSVWGSGVTTFVVRDGSQFRAPPPYGAASNAAAVKTPRYTRDYEEVKRLGCNGCTPDAPETGEIAQFWIENSPAAWHRIARTLADAQHLDAWQTARVLALVQLAEFDGYATALESKYFYNFWRPVTAIERADADGNPATATQAGWQVRSFPPIPTPPVPDYPSAHAVAGGAAQAVLDGVLLGTGPFLVSSTSLPGVTRHFPNVKAAARENADSRVYVGFHFRHATDTGLEQGRAVGAFVVGSSLRPLQHR